MSSNPLPTLPPNPNTYKNHTEPVTWSGDVSTEFYLFPITFCGLLSFLCLPVGFFWWGWHWGEGEV